MEGFFQCSKQYENAGKKGAGERSQWRAQACGQGFGQTLYSARGKEGAARENRGRGEWSDERENTQEVESHCGRDGVRDAGPGQFRGAGARPGADAVEGDLAERNCGGGIAAWGAGGSANPGARRERGGRGDCDERNDGRGRADDERNGRRLVRDCVRREGEEALRIERERMGAEGIVHRTCEEAGIEGDADGGSDSDHGAGRGGGVAEAGGQVWAEEIVGGFGGGHRDGARRIPGAGMGCDVLGGGGGVSAGKSRGDPGVLAE